MNFPTTGAVELDTEFAYRNQNNRIVIFGLRKKLSVNFFILHRRFSRSVQELISRTLLEIMNNSPYNAYAIGMNSYIRE
jgi:hypothetical protein